MRTTIYMLGLVLCAQFSVCAQSYEHRVIAAVIVAEAADQGTTGMRAVGEVIHARSVKLDCRPLAVVTQRNRSSGVWAFSCLNGVGPKHLVIRLQNSPEFATALRIARQVVDQPAHLGNTTRGATFFTKKSETPKWARGKRPTVVIGDHAFYRLPVP